MRDARPAGVQAADERVKASACQSTGLLPGCSLGEITTAVEPPLFYHTRDLHQTGHVREPRYSTINIQKQPVLHSH
jgi:hypothetical protein